MKGSDMREKSMSTIGKIMGSKYFNYFMVVLLTTSVIGNFLLCGKNCSTETKVVKVDIELLVRKLVKDVAEQKQKDIEKSTKDQLARVDSLLQKLAEQEKFIILPAKAVVAGGVDITAQVEALLKNTEMSREKRNNKLFEEVLRVGE